MSVRTIDDTINPAHVALTPEEIQLARRALAAKHDGARYTTDTWVIENSCKRAISTLDGYQGVLTQSELRTLLGALTFMNLRLRFGETTAASDIMFLRHKLIAFKDNQ